MVKNKSKQGPEIVYVLFWAPTVLFFNCTLLLIGSVGQTIVKYDEFAFAEFVITNFIICDHRFYEGFPKLPKGQGDLKAV